MIEITPDDGFQYGSMPSSVLQYRERYNKITRTDCTINGKVHHFHREPIECLDTKTVEDLPSIDKCCRCGFEQDIQKAITPISRHIPTTKKYDDMKAERSEADALMKVYNEKRQKRLQKEALKFANGK